MLVLLLACGLAFLALQGDGSPVDRDLGVLSAQRVDVETSIPVDVVAARRAAIEAVALTDEVVEAGFITRRDLIEGFATDDLAPRLVADTSAQVNALLVELGSRDADVTQVSLIEQPLSARATVIGDVVQVEVWSLLVIAVPGTGPARQAWRTVTLDMVLVDGRWLVSDWQSRPGPTPAPAVEAAFDDAATVDDVLAWEQVTSSIGVR
jgi:hypothetical protein